MRADAPVTAYPQVEVAPPDEYNAQLLANAHPADWHNPEPRNPYNLVVLGGGTAGLCARVALVEPHLHIGGSPSAVCVP
jgi:hypothetical protein